MDLATSLDQSLDGNLPPANNLKVRTAAYSLILPIVMAVVTTDVRRKGVTMVLQRNTTIGKANHSSGHFSP